LWTEAEENEGAEKGSEYVVCAGDEWNTTMMIGKV
jgi:hypothetical protein